MNPMDMMVEPDEVDFNAYLAEQEAPKVLPASHWLPIDEGDEPVVKAYRYPWARLSRLPMRMHELTLWTGHGKHGKTTALNQAVLCAMSQGAKVGIVSLEFPAEVQVKVMRWQGFGFTHGTMSGEERDLFREWVDERLWFYDHHGMQEGVRIAAVAWHMAKNLGCDLVVVDSLMMCGVRSDGDGFGTAQTEFVNRLLNVSREFPCHIHLVAHARKDKDDSRPPGLLDVSGHANLVNLPHNVVSFWRNKRDASARTEDAILSVLGDRMGGFDGTAQLWFHESARQYIESRDQMPERYVR